MTISFPLGLSSFWDESFMNVRTGSISLTDVRKSNMTAGGVVLDASRGWRMWRGSAEITTQGNVNSMAVDALLSLLTRGGASFLVYDKRAPDLVNGAPSGCTLTVVASDMVTLTLGGFPASFQLVPGDALSFTYGSSPTKYAYHRVVNYPSPASGGGVISGVQVEPPIFPGYSLPASLTTVKASFKAKIVPGSLQPSVGKPGQASSGARFDFAQTLGV